MKNDTVTIKRNKTVISTFRSELASIAETSDGITFQFKDGTFFYCVDAQMSSAAKQIIKNSFDFIRGNLIIDLLNYTTPARIEI
ncbi:MAG: hypothetical protein BWY04_00476 [candidate division CPR1 bacterium ADurb.Bin160]|uniref:Uncharacterized protein n=1 Tax=candidate division CPR1 bacterium ADurb.Bin160 TaxID=1852826 RepID=A0A1V5ZNX1_9BACT|nr:MAG: hypothetical protein BWY04_00476 [candidate division CPR1 bacterium ADurb.Bin160]